MGNANNCRSTLLTALPVTSPAMADDHIGIPENAVSLVVENPSYLTVRLRFGPEAVDMNDALNGYVVELPGVSLSAFPIPADVDLLAIATVSPAVAPDANGDRAAVIDTSGSDVIRVWACPTNQGTFVGSINSTPVTSRSLGT